MLCSWREGLSVGLVSVAFFTGFCRCAHNVVPTQRAREVATATATEEAEATATATEAEATAT